MRTRNPAQRTHQWPLLIGALTVLGATMAACTSSAATGSNAENLWIDRVGRTFPVIE